MGTKIIVLQHNNKFVYKKVYTTLIPSLRDDGMILSRDSVDIQRHFRALGHFTE